MPGLHLSHRRKLPLENVQRVLFLRFQIPELHMLENDFERVADATELAPIAPDPIEKLPLEVGFTRGAEIDVDEAELSALLIESHGIYRLPELLRREGKSGRHGGLLADLAQAAQCPTFSPLSRHPSTRVLRADFGQGSLHRLRGDDDESAKRRIHLTALAIKSPSFLPQSGRGEIGDLAVHDCRIAVEPGRAPCGPGEFWIVLPQVGPHLRPGLVDPAQAHESDGEVDTSVRVRVIRLLERGNRIFVISKNTKRQTSIVVHVSRTA